MLLEYLEVPYEIKYYEQGNGPDFSRDEWLNEKFKLGFPFPNLPYLITSDGFKLSESDAISRYLCDKHDDTLLGVDVEERATVLMLNGVYWSLKNDVTKPCYYKTLERDQIYPAVKGKVEQIVAFLGSKKFFMGDNVRYIDFQYCEVFELIDYISNGLIYNDFPSLKTFVKSVLDIPSLLDYRKNRFQNLPFNNKIAAIGADSS
jgi:glutathione S-transferase